MIRLLRSGKILREKKSMTNNNNNIIFWGEGGGSHLWVAWKCLKKLCGGLAIQLLSYSQLKFRLSWAVKTGRVLGVWKSPQKDEIVSEQPLAENKIRFKQISIKFEYKEKAGRE
jgi:hypothetical protein